MSKVTLCSSKRFLFHFVSVHSCHLYLKRAQSLESSQGWAVLRHVSHTG